MPAALIQILQDLRDFEVVIVLLDARGAYAAASPRLSVASAALPPYCLLLREHGADALVKTCGKNDIQHGLGVVLGMMTRILLGVGLTVPLPRAQPFTTSRKLMGGVALGFERSFAQFRRILVMTCFGM